MKKQKIFSDRHKIFYSILTKRFITIPIQQNFQLNIKKKTQCSIYLLNNKNIEKEKISFDRQKIVCWKSNRKTQFKIGSFNIKKLATENIF